MHITTAVLIIGLAADDDDDDDDSTLVVLVDMVLAHSYGSGQLTSNATKKVTRWSAIHFISPSCHV